jgi:hypothetical protein
VSPSTRRLLPALVAAVVLVVVLVVVLAVIALAGRDNDVDTGPAGAGNGSSDDRSGQGGMAPMTRFTDVHAGARDRSVEVTFYGGVDTCYTYVVRADETTQQVALSLSEERKGDGPCIDLAQEYERSVALERPLGDRRVVDAATGDVLIEPAG